MVRITGVFVSLALLVAAGCGEDTGEALQGHGHHGGHLAETYAAVVLASYEDSLAAAEELDRAIGELVKSPSAANLEAARTAWYAAREPYLQTEAYRFYDGPIDHEPKGDDDEEGPEGLLNAWPLDENYIDYVADDAEAGIVNDPSVEISKEELAALNAQGGEENIATGYHAIEFLLWGQDRSETGPGARPHTDYVTGNGGTAETQDRRGEYLTAVSSLLVDNLQSLVDAWKPDEDNYRAELEGLEEGQALERILTGMIILSGFETGGERLQTALDTGEQEDEHSCFSDNTTRDMVQDVRGIQNVYLGRYETVDGDTVSGERSVRDAVADRDEALAEKVEARIAESLELAEALERPFDREISLDNEEGRERVAALIASLRTQEEDLMDVFQEFELTVDIPQPGE